MSVSVLSFDGASVAKNLGSVALAGSRPNFEVAFNNLQNAILKRLDDKINQFTRDGSVNNVDVFLMLRKEGLELQKPKLEQYGRDVLQQKYELESLSTLVDKAWKAAASGDQAAYELNSAAADTKARELTVPNGAEFGIYNDEVRLLRDGDGRDAVPKPGFTWPTLTGDVVADAAAVGKVVDKMNGLLTTSVVQQEDVFSLIQNLDQDLADVTVKVTSIQLEDKKAKIEEVKKLKEQYGYLLQAVSLSFEVQAQQTESFSKQLFTDGQPPAGSVLNLFT